MTKKYVLILGNGFSLDMLEKAKLQSSISLTQMIPPSDDVKYLRFAMDRFTERPLWDREIWPITFDLFEHVGGDQWPFFTHLADNISRVLADPATDTITIPHSIGEALELRFYLWQLFRYNDAVWRRHEGWNALTDWQWKRVLRKLIAEHELTIISFNYDIMFESLCLSGVDAIVDTGKRFLYNPSNCMAELWRRKPGWPLLLKPHGSLSYDRLGTMLIGCGNTWLDPSAHITLRGIHGTPRFGWPLDNMPILLPDLVPPGHSELHRLETATDVVLAINQSIHECDALILCGLSAREPDTKEVRQYLSNLKTGTPVIHVDKNRDNDAGRLLKAVSADSYSECEIDEVETIPARLLAMH